MPDDIGVESFEVIKRWRLVWICDPNEPVLLVFPDLSVDTSGISSSLFRVESA